jgi:hypothetical protein
VGRKKKVVSCFGMDDHEIVKNKVITFVNYLILIMPLREEGRKEGRKRQGKYRPG